MLPTLKRINTLRQQVRDALRSNLYALAQATRRHPVTPRTQTWSTATRLDMRVWPDGQITERS
jgi:hypothetical protein